MDRPAVRFLEGATSEVAQGALRAQTASAVFLKYRGRPQHDTEARIAQIKQATSAPYLRSSIRREGCALFNALWEEKR
jgi:hypothetical protein